MVPSICREKVFWPQFNHVNRSLIKRELVRDFTSYHCKNGVFELQTKPNEDGPITLRAPRPSDTQKRHQYSVWASRSRSARRNNRPDEGHTRERSPYQQRRDTAPSPQAHRSTTNQQQRQLLSVQHAFAQGIQSSQECSQQPIDSDTVRHLRSRHRQDHSTHSYPLRDYTNQVLEDIRISGGGIIYTPTPILLILPTAVLS